MTAAAPRVYAKTKPPALPETPRKSRRWPAIGIVAALAAVLLTTLEPRSSVYERAPADASAPGLLARAKKIADDANRRGDSVFVSRWHRLKSAPQQAASNPASREPIILPPSGYKPR